MSASFVLPLLEQAGVNFLAAQTFAQTDEDGIALDAERILKGFQRVATVDEEKKIPLPYALVSCVTATAESLFSGNWTAQLDVELRSKVFDTSDAAHQAMAEELFAFFFSSTIAADLTAALSGFTAFLILPVQQSRAIENNSWVSRGRFTVRCCGSTIS